MFAQFLMTSQDGTLFTGLGLGDCLDDQLTFPTYNETSGGVYNRSFAQYVTDYSEAGFNIFRWSNGNCAFRIEKSFDGNPGRPVQTPLPHWRVNVNSGSLVGCTILFR